jgi:hypothetical protein
MLCLVDMWSFRFWCPVALTRSFEMLATSYKTTKHNISEDHNPNFHRRVETSNITIVKLRCDEFTCFAGFCSQITYEDEESTFLLWTFSTIREYVCYIQNMQCFIRFPYTLYFIKIGFCHNPQDDVKRQEIAVGNAILCMQYLTASLFVTSGSGLWQEYNKIVRSNFIPRYDCRILRSSKQKSELCSAVFLRVDFLVSEKS